MSEITAILHLDMTNVSASFDRVASQLAGFASLYGQSRRERIAAKIAERSHAEDRGYEVDGKPSLCRIWDGPTSGKNTRGHSYGRMNLDGATVAVHIAAWVNEHGLIPPRKQLDHLCEQRDCCEETHLELVTHKRNQRRRDERRKRESARHSQWTSKPGLTL